MSDYLFLFLLDDFSEAVAMGDGWHDALQSLYASQDPDDPSMYIARRPLSLAEADRHIASDGEWVPHFDMDRDDAEWATIVP